MQSVDVEKKIFYAMNNPDLTESLLARTDYHRLGSVSTVVAHDTPLSWLGIHRHGS